MYREGYGRQRDRREFLKLSAAAFATGRELTMNRAAKAGTTGEFTAYQEKRRRELWALLGDLPWDHKPGPAKQVATEKHEGYTL